MTASLVLTVLGDDRPGLVDDLSGVITAHKANWEESRMSHLAGKFAGILRISAPDHAINDLIQALEDLNASGLRVVVELSGEAAPEAGDTGLTLELVGQDHPGIVHDITHALASLEINVEEFSSAVENASMAGGDLFRAEIRLRVPPTVSQEQLRELMENLANELMVDITLDPAD